MSPPAAQAAACYAFGVGPYRNAQIEPAPAPPGPPLRVFWIWVIASVPTVVLFGLCVWLRLLMGTMR